jgi:hypothetical protein
VTEEHTINTVEMRHDDGVFASQALLIPSVYHHHTRDFAVMHLENEEETVAKLKSEGLLTINLLEDEMLKENDELQFHGHEVTGGSFNATVDDRKPFPRIGF